ncbi:MAG: hypothetical protein HY927_07290 [Elusimicrobia bacterium]|nr:hypothetical protein [Elusimicrobiota bacterium]
MHPRVPAAGWRPAILIGIALCCGPRLAQAASLALPAPRIPATGGLPGVGGLAVSSDFLRNMQGGSPLLPRFDAELPTPFAPALLQAPALTPAPADFSTSKPEAGKDAPLERYRAIESGAPSNLKALSAAQMQDLWRRTYGHKIAGLDDWRKLAKYDPQGIIGFCFGRAMTVQLLARELGLAADSIRKILVIGDLRSGKDPEWRFHIATLVKGDDGRWHAIDPIMDAPVTVDQWIAGVHKGWDKQKKAKFYSLPADAVMPNLSLVPDLPKEAGERIIELAFNPEGAPGFSRWTGAKEPVYELDAQRRDRHLVIAGSDAAPFDFHQVTINGQSFAYNGYFADLLEELVRPSPTRRDPEKLLRAIPPASPSLGLDVSKLRR